MPERVSHACRCRVSLPRGRQWDPCSLFAERVANKRVNRDANKEVKNLRGFCHRLGHKSRDAEGYSLPAPSPGSLARLRGTPRCPSAIYHVCSPGYVPGPTGFQLHPPSDSSSRTLSYSSTAWAASPNVTKLMEAKAARGAAHRRKRGRPQEWRRRGRGRNHVGSRCNYWIS